MSTVRIFNPKNRLAMIVGKAGDSTFETLTTNAERNLVSAGDTLRAFVREQMVIMQSFGAKAEDVVFAQSRTLAAAALAVAEVAGAAGSPALSEAARGVIVMIEALSSHGVWHSEALRLHIEALARLSADPPPSEAEARGVVNMLEALRNSVGVNSQTANWEPEPPKA